MVPGPRPPRAATLAVSFDNKPTAHAHSRTLTLARARPCPLTLSRYSRPRPLAPVRAMFSFAKCDSSPPPAYDEAKSATYLEEAATSKTVLQVTWYDSPEVSRQSTVWSLE